MTLEVRLKSVKAWKQRLQNLIKKPKKYEKTFKKLISFNISLKTKSLKVLEKLNFFVFSNASLTILKFFKSCIKFFLQTLTFSILSYNWNNREKSFAQTFSSLSSVFFQKVNKFSVFNWNEIQTSLHRLPKDFHCSSATSLIFDDSRFSFSQTGLRLYSQPVIVTNYVSSLLLFRARDSSTNFVFVNHGNFLKISLCIRLVCCGKISSSSHKFSHPNQKAKKKFCEISKYDT